MNSIHESAVSGATLLAIFKESPYLSTKHTTYFPVYEELLGPYANRKITFVEIGVLNGGSLFMWRKFLGTDARIIGIDLNPSTARWKDDGFEIHIGNQTDPMFWKGFFEQVGDVDVILDDGGHTNEQQVVTTLECLSHIRDGGLLIVEDVHTSYKLSFGNPSSHSFIHMIKTAIDVINARAPRIRAKGPSIVKSTVHSIRCFESIVCLYVNRRLCVESSVVTNSGQPLGAADFRYSGTWIEKLFTGTRLDGILTWLYQKVRNRKLRRLLNK